MTTLQDVLESSAMERVATGFRFTEGPLWHPDGYFYFVDVRSNLLYRMVLGPEAGEGARDPWRQRHNIRPAGAAAELRGRRAAGDPHRA